MTKKRVALIAIALFLTFTGAAVLLQKGTAQMQDRIQYNAVYECGGMKSKFKVLSCKGTGKFDRCDVFYINELSPGGGNKVSTYRSGIEDDIKQGCKIKGRAAANNEPGEDEQIGDETPVSKSNNILNKTAPNKIINNSSVACSTSDSDSDGKTANEKTFRGVIRRLWEKEAREGSDGAVTITFEKLVVGATRAWRPTVTDAYSQANPKKPIYAVRASFETCTDYRRAISKRKMERIYDCFVHKAGGWQCTQTGASGPLATKDKEEYIQKQ